MAVFLAFRWVVFFAEDITLYNVNFYFLWIGVGVCLSKEMRKLTDNDIRKWFANMIVPQRKLYSSTV